MPTLEDTLADRMKRFEHIGCLKHVRSAFDAAINTHLTVRSSAQDVAAKLAKDNRLTPIGRKDKMHEHVSKEAHRVARAQKTFEQIKRRHVEELAAVQPKAPDKTDVAAAVARSDLRSMLRGMQMAKAAQLLIGPEADAILQAAVLELPNYASGINDEIRRIVTEQVIEREHPGALAELEQKAEAIELLGVAVHVLERTFREVAEFPNEKFLNDFIEKSVGDTSRMESEIASELAA
ncbi:hypothetical protein IVB11_29895 [Bradyrhizobium sp. 177]|uniref:hypothetical protein n=1 Tax=Bradyrhizobium sp. 177 TaxID=2782647 RepID=UPI001FFA0E0D|nr:hypothetical protein [Bradyrhizobium sp. 177]MCK1553139.1 hypothetical protein [Bradyrhizobium sp. 177]